MSEAALELARHALGFAGDETAEVTIHRERATFARFARSHVFQPTVADDLTIQLRIVRGERAGTATTNDGSDAALACLVRRAQAAAEHAPPEPGRPDLARPVALPAVDGYDPATAATTAAELCEVVRDTMPQAPGLQLFGYLTSGVSEIALASSAGVAVSQAMTDAAAVALAAGDGMSAFADAVAVRVGDIDMARVSGAAAEKALRTRDAATLEPGTYAAVLEPSAFGMLLHEFGRKGFRGRELLDGTSYFTDRIGEPVFHPELTIVDDGTHAQTLPKAFDADGVPKRRVPLIEAGVARSVVWDRVTAAEAGDAAASTGHAVPRAWEDPAPTPLNLVVTPGRASREELAAAVGDGIWITRLHYLSVVDPREGVITGMTRDGTFRIRNGRIAEPLVNLRFTTSFPALARDVAAIGDDPRLVAIDHFYEPRYPNAPLVPGLATTSFQVVGNGSVPGL